MHNTKFNSENINRCSFNDGSKGYAQVWNLNTGKITPKLQMEPIITLNLQMTETQSCLETINYMRNSGISTNGRFISEQKESSSHTS